MAHFRFLFLACFLVLFSDLSAQWSTYTPMPGTRWTHVCAAAAGRLYVAGGSTGPTWEYDGGSNNWTVRASIPTLRPYPGIASWGGMIYVLGGSVGAAWSDKNERFDPGTNTWTTMAAMPTARYRVDGATLDDCFYVLGGYNGSNLSTNEGFCTVNLPITVQLHGHTKG